MIEGIKRNRDWFTVYSLRFTVYGCLRFTVYGCLQLVGVDFLRLPLSVVPPSIVRGPWSAVCAHYDSVALAPSTKTVTLL